MNVYENNHYFLKNNKRHLVYDITKKELDLIMSVILNECNLNAFGYDRAKDEYWGKIYGKFSFIIKAEDFKMTVHTEYDQSRYTHNLCIKISESLALYEEIPKL
jgi:hypothetical protein